MTPFVDECGRRRKEEVVMLMNEMGVMRVVRVEVEIKVKW